MSGQVTTTLTPPGPAGAVHLKIVIEGVCSLLEAIWQMNLVFLAVNTDRVDMLFDHNSGVLTLQTFVQKP
jgi:hypothetical protein